MVLQFLLQRETNWTSALFRAGYIPPCIRSITDRRLFLPMSQSHTALSSPYDVLTRCREQYEVSTFRWGNMRAGRRLLSTGKLFELRELDRTTRSLAYLRHFGSSGFIYFHLSRMTVLCRFTSIRHTHYLTLTYLIADRRRSSSRISIPCAKAFRYIVGPAALFRALDSLRSRSGPMIETIPPRDLVSHVQNASLHLQKNKAGRFFGLVS